MRTGLQTVPMYLSIFRCNLVRLVHAKQLETNATLLTRTSGGFVKMKTKSILNLLLGTLMFTLVSACGGGGGGSNITVTQPSTAVITLSTNVIGSIPATTTINSYNVTIILPEGVTVKSTVNPPETDANVVIATGNAAGASISAVYTAASGTLPGTLKIYVASAAGFDAGEFCKVSCDISSGHYPTASDFVPPTLDDATGIDASVSTVTLTNDLSLTSTAVID
jgi:hypothetical protein